MTTAIVTTVLLLLSGGRFSCGLGGAIGEVELAILFLGVAVAITLVVRRAQTRSAGRNRGTSA